MALSFLPAWAVGVVSDAAFAITFVDNVSVTAVFDFINGIVSIESIILTNVFFLAPRQRQGKQGEDCYY